MLHLLIKLRGISSDVFVVIAAVLFFFFVCVCVCACVRFVFLLVHFFGEEFGGEGDR